MVETARIVSTEGAALVERQTSAVLGDIKKLTQQIQVGAIFLVRFYSLVLFASVLLGEMGIYGHAWVM